MWLRAVTYAEMKAETASLKARVEVMREIINDLLKGSAALEEKFAAERARADIAVDRMLGQQGVPPITPVQAPTLEDLSSMFEEDPIEVKAIREAIKERGAENVLLGIE